MTMQNTIAWTAFSITMGACAKNPGNGLEHYGKRNVSRGRNNPPQS